MSAQVKPARLIERLTGQLTKLTANIKTLEAAAAIVPERIQDAVDTAVGITRIEANQRYTVLAMRLSDAEDEVVDLRRRLAAKDSLLSEIRAMRDQLGPAVADLVAQNAAQKLQLDAIAPQLAELESKREALTHLCDDVRARMRRREQAEERAILNRKAFVGVMPARNRG